MLWTNGYVNGRELSVVIIFTRMNIVSYIVFIPAIRIVFHTCIGAYYDYLIITRLRIRIYDNVPIVFPVAPCQASITLDKSTE